MIAADLRVAAAGGARGDGRGDGRGSEGGAGRGPVTDLHGENTFRLTLSRICYRFSGHD